MVGASQEYDSVGFRVLAENTTDKELLVSKIFEEDVFQRQGAVSTQFECGASRLEYCSFSLPAKLYFNV